MQRNHNINRSLLCLQTSLPLYGFILSGSSYNIIGSFYSNILGGFCCDVIRNFCWSFNASSPNNNLYCNYNTTFCYSITSSFCCNFFNNLCCHFFLNYKRKWFKQPQLKFTSKWAHTHTSITIGVSLISFTLHVVHNKWSEVTIHSKRAYIRRSQALRSLLVSFVGPPNANSTSHFQIVHHTCIDTWKAVLALSRFKQNEQ